MQKANAASVPRAERIIGQADCLVTDIVGACVCIIGTKIGARYQVTTALANDPSRRPAVGVIVKKTSSTKCHVQFHGPLRGIYTGLSTGRVYYLGLTGTLVLPGHPSFPLDGSLQQLGVATAVDELLLAPLETATDTQQAVVSFTASCLSTDAVGDCVHAVTSGVGSLPYVTKFIPSMGVGQAVGVVGSKLSATICDVLVAGLLRGVYVGLTAGRPYFVGLDGKLTTAILVPPDHGRVLVQQVAVALNSDVLLVDLRTPTIRTA